MEIWNILVNIENNRARMKYPIISETVIKANNYKMIM